MFFTKFPEPTGISWLIFLLLQLIKESIKPSKIKINQSAVTWHQAKKKHDVRQLNIYFAKRSPRPTSQLAPTGVMSDEFVYLKCQIFTVIDHFMR